MTGIGRPCTLPRPNLAEPTACRTAVVEPVLAAAPAEALPAITVTAAAPLPYPGMAAAWPQSR